MLLAGFSQLDATVLTTIVLIVDQLVRLGLAVRVVMRRLPVGVSLAWLMVVLSTPLLGTIIYLTFGELRLGRKRALRAAKFHGPYQEWLKELRNRPAVDWQQAGGKEPPLSRLIHRAVGIPPLPGNQLEMIDQWQQVYEHLIRDIDQARRTCHLEFYIWYEGGLADEVAAALIRAAERGVTCRVLLDDVGSRAFLRGQWPPKFREAGIQLRSALPANLLRMAFVRFDLRMHRKIVVIDGRVAYTGSLNLVDPRYFKQSSGVGQWIDAMVRIEGPVVEALAITFLEDWASEGDDDIEFLQDHADVHPMRPRGEAPVQIVPSGPAQPRGAMERILISMIYQARQRVILTTPYFVPDESLVKALLSAVQRGVEVILIVPAKVDSRLVRWASQAFLGDLVVSGAKIMKFQDGLLHTKSVTVDDEVSMFGSLNLDPRSLHLNFEITLVVYDQQFTMELRKLQEDYASRSRRLMSHEWFNRHFGARFVENAARLLGPLL